MSCLQLETISRNRQIKNKLRCSKPSPETMITAPAGADLVAVISPHQECPPETQVPGGTSERIPNDLLSKPPPPQMSETFLTPTHPSASGFRASLAYSTMQQVFRASLAYSTMQQVTLKLHLILESPHVSRHYNLKFCYD